MKQHIRLMSSTMTVIDPDRLPEAVVKDLQPPSDRNKLLDVPHNPPNEILNFSDALPSKIQDTWLERRERRQHAKLSATS